MNRIKTPLRIAASAVILMALTTSPSSAALLNVTNAGFEDITGESPVNEFTFGALNGWSLYEETPGLTSNGDGPHYFIGTLTPTGGEFFPGGASEGNRVGLAFNYFGSPNTGSGLEYGLFQSLSETLQANTQYTLQVDIGNIASGTAVNNDFFDLSGFPGYRVDLMAGTTVLDSDNNSLAGSIAEGAFGLSTVTFTTGATHSQLGQNLGIRLVNLNVTDPSAPNADLEVDFDNVRLDATAIPEPSSLLLILIAIGSLCFIRRRSSKTSHML